MYPGFLRRTIDFNPISLFIYLCTVNALGGGAIDGRGGFKADEAAARVEGGHGGCAGASADVRHHLAGACVGLDEILAQLHGLLGRVYGVGHGLHEQHIGGITPPVMGGRALPFKLAVIGAGALAGVYLTVLWSSFFVTLRAKKILL